MHSAYSEFYLNLLFPFLLSFSGLTDFLSSFDCFSDMVSWRVLLPFFLSYVMKLEAV